MDGFGQQAPVREKLHWKNYSTWRPEMQDYLKNQGLWGVVSGAESSGPDGASSSEWTEKNAKALRAIKVSCSGTYCEIHGATEAKSAWNALIKKYRREEGHIEPEGSGRPTLERAAEPLIGAQDRPFLDRVEPLLWAKYIRNADLNKLTEKRIIGSSLVIPENQYTALHVAVSAGQLEVVNYFLEQNTSNQDALVDTKRRTALALAAYHGKLEIVRKIVDKYPGWLLIKDDKENIPLIAACEGGHADTTHFLREKTFDYLQEQQREEASGHQNIQVHREFEKETEYWLILGCLRSKMFDIALEALNRDPENMFLHSSSVPLLTLAETPTAFNIANWRELKNQWVFKGKIAPESQLSRISGAALQMQRELQWIREVESIVPDYFKESKNEGKDTPSDVFTEEHAKLLENAEKWMKETASYYSIVGALIITITFAAAFTVPGGNDQIAGVPIFRHEVLFKTFIILVATSFSAASTSVMVFLGILTSRYAEQDFHNSLPRKLMVGLFSLFISMSVMMAAFSVAIVLMFKGKRWIIIVMTILGVIPVLSFARQHLPLLKEIFVSTYLWRVFKKKRSPYSRPWLSTENVRARSSNQPPTGPASANKPPTQIASTNVPPVQTASAIEPPSAETTSASEQLAETTSTNVPLADTVVEISTLVRGKELM